MLVVSCIILVLVWLVYLYVQVPHRQAPFKQASTKTVSVTLQRGKAKVTLHRKSDKEWTVDAGGYPADMDHVKALLSGLEDTQIEDKISERADRAADFEVNPETGTRVTALDAQGHVVGEGIFGKQAPDFSHVYFRYVDRPDVYLARGLIRGELGDASLAYWRSRAMVAIPEAEVQSITIQGKGFTTTLTRSTTSTWLMNGTIIDPNPVYTLVGALAHLQADDFVDLASSPSLTPASLTMAHITIKGSHDTAELSLGPEDKASRRYPVSTGASAGTAWVSEAKINAILLKPSSFPALKKS